MAIGRPMPPLILDDEERETLERWVRRPKTAQALALRARMVLACAEGRSNTAVGAELGVSDETVGKWRSRFVERRLDGLSDEPRSGRPRSVTDEDVERVITLTLETTPKDATHWSTRSMAQRSGLSHNTIGRIWRAFGLQPHRVTSNFKMCISSKVELTHPMAVASSADFSRRCRRDLANGGNDERDLRDERRGTFDPGHSQGAGHIPQHGASVPEVAGGDATQATAAAGVEAGPIH